jgi:F-type H+-transporting ATPase subunit b
VKSLLIALAFCLCFSPVAATFAADAGHVHVGADENTNEDLLEFKGDLAIYTFLVFIGLLLLLWRFAFGPIAKALHDREEGIGKMLADAKAEREKAEELRSSYEGMLEAAGDKVREIYAEANAKAEEMRAKRVSEADQEAQSRIQQAIQEIERAKDQAISELLEMENQRIVQATEHVLGRALTEDDQNRLVNEALAHFSNN